MMPLYCTITFYCFLPATFERLMQTFFLRFTNTSFYTLLDFMANGVCIVRFFPKYVFCQKSMLKLINTANICRKNFACCPANRKYDVSIAVCYNLLSINWHEINFELNSNWTLLSLNRIKTW